MKKHDNQAPINFTEGAKNEIIRLSKEQKDKENILRIGVEGGGCAGLNYVLAFDKQTDDDTVYEIQDITFIINKSHVLYLEGMEVDWQDGLNSRGFTFKNPNASSTCGCGTSFSI